MNGTVLPEVAAPKVPPLAAQQPDLRVTLDPCDKVIDFTRDDPQVAIRLGTGHYPSLYSKFLFRQTVFPVAQRAPADPYTL